MTVTRRLRASVAAVLLLAACSGDDEDRVAPFVPAIVEDVPPVDDSSTINSLEASIENVSTSAESGGTLSFTVVLSNPADEPVRLDPCPAHSVTVGESGETFNDGPWLLNCSEVPELGANAARRFGVVVRVPEQFDLEGTSITWRLVQPHGVGDTHRLGEPAP